MKSYNMEQFSAMRIILILGFVFALYMIYSLTVSIYDNYRIEQHIEEFESRNEELLLENQKKLSDFQYYTSEEYVEKMAKTNLGLISPGEKVIIIPNDNFIVMNEDEDSAQINAQIRASWPNHKKWWMFIFSYNPFKV